MNLIRATGRLLSNSQTTLKFRPSVRGAIYLDKDWMPGPYPKTESERIAAAKKYNLLPEEYEPYDPEKWEFSYGDYPHLPNRFTKDQDPYYAWDYINYRKGYGETWHVHTELYRPYSIHCRQELNGYDVTVSFLQLCLIYGLACGLASAYCYWTHYIFEGITRFKEPHRIFPGETYYHYPNSNTKVYEW